jgi:hypothetical protein
MLMTAETWLSVRPKAGAQNKYSVTHPMTNLCDGCLVSAIATLTR